MSTDPGSGELFIDERSALAWIMFGAVGTLVVGGLAFQQLWLFWVAPLIGGAAGGWLYKTLGADSFPKPNIEGE